jgi:cytochrome c oxidase cbb3-type subunit 4
VSSLEAFFHTEWEAMTASDWIVLVTTVVIFLLMVGLYIYALRPKNRERLESYRNIPFDDETTTTNSGEKNGGE